MVEISKLKFCHDFEVNSLSRLWGWDLVKSLKLKIGQNIAAEFWSRLLGWSYVGLPILKAHRPFARGWSLRIIIFKRLAPLDDHLQEAGPSGWSFARVRPLQMTICKRPVPPDHHFQEASPSGWPFARGQSLPGWSFARVWPRDQSYGILLNQIGNALITPVTRMQQIPRGHIMQLMTRIYIVTIFVFTIHLCICVVFVFVIVLWADCAPNPHERALNWPLRQWSILAGLLNWSMLLCYYIALSIKNTLMSRSPLIWNICVFSVKINISTTGGFRVGFFQPDTNHP